MLVLIAFVCGLIAGVNAERLRQRLALRKSLTSAEAFRDAEIMARSVEYVMQGYGSAYAKERAQRDMLNEAESAQQAQQPADTVTAQPTADPAEIIRATAGFTQGQHEQEQTNLQQSLALLNAKRENDLAQSALALNAAHGAHRFALSNSRIIDPCSQ